MYEKYFKYLEFLAPPTPIIVGAWSLTMLIGCAYSIYCTKQISAPVAVIFSAVLTNFTAHKIMNGQAQANVESAKPNLDVQGDDNGQDKGNSK